MNLPVDAALPELLDALRSRRRAVLTAPPGSGKTTRVPLALMEEREGIVIMLEPRRLAARSAARFMAAQRGEKAGASIGYRVRLESAVSRATRVEIVTEGVLTRRLIADPELSGVSSVIFDEFHERSLQADTGLALCLEVQQALRPDLDILVMSATLDAKALAAWLDCPAVRAEGRSFPVNVRYLPCPPGHSILSHTAAAVRRALAEESGSILVFLPGRGEIRRVTEMLGELPAGVSLHPLYGDLGVEEQDRAIAPAAPGKRKVVLATAIAETSLTIEGVRLVIDAGLVRTARFSPATGMSALVTERVTRDCADQRAGRAGRREPGVCWRLWHEGEVLRPCRRPEILEADLTPFLLDALAWGSDPRSLRLFTPPPEASLDIAFQTLTALGAVEETGRPHLTPHGLALSRIPLHPRLAHMVLAAGKNAPLAAALAAAVEERVAAAGCDIRPRLAALKRDFRLRRSAEQILALATGGSPRPLPDVAQTEAEAGALLSLAWPERIAQRRNRGSFRLASGRGAQLPQEDALADEDFLAVAALDGGAAGTGRIHLAAPLSREDLLRLHGSRLRRVETVFWDESTEAALARQRVLFGALVLEDAPLPHVPHDAAHAEALRAAVLDGIRRLGLACLPWTEELREWQARVLFLRSLKGADDEDGGEWPDVSDAALSAALAGASENWLSPWLSGVTRRTQFSGIALGKALHALLPYALARRLERDAPTHFTVPSGSSVRIRYTTEGGPSLAVKLQEMFGQPTSPAICRGRCPLTLHLLSPAGRPLQITRDLAGFWKNGYAAVRAEMRGRYPKHPWPENPVAAVPTRKTKRALKNG